MAAGYLFVTSDDFRSRVESSASAYSGRKTHIAKITIDWGSTAHVHLDGVEVANADWGKADHMLKAEQVDFDIRLWPLLKGDIVLPSLVLRKPEVAVEVGDKEQLNWSLGESPVTTGVAKAVAPKERYRDAAGRPSRDHRRASLLPGHQAQARARRHGVDGGRQGRRPAPGRAAAQGQAREPAAHRPLRRRLGPDATAKPLTLSLIGGGTIAGELAIDAQTDVPKVRAALKGTNIELGMFFRNSRYFDTTKGKIQGQVALAGSGKSLAQVMSVADGHVEVAIDAAAR